MKKLLLSFALVAFFGLAATAQEQGLIRATGGLAYGTEVEELGINIGGEYLITDVISGGANFTYFFTPENITWTEFNIDGKYYFLTDGPYVYGLAGIGIVSYKVDVDFGPFGSSSVSDSATGLNIGAGAIFPLSDNFGIQTQLKYNTAYDGQLVIQGGVAFDF